MVSIADRSISISIEARVSSFTANLRTAARSVDELGGRLGRFAQENEQSLDRVGKASMVMGGGLLAGALMAVKSFAEFSSAMSEVEASTHETAANMDLLRDAAINAGADTAFSAKEAAQGIDELAKAGVSTKDILSGGLSGALNLAAAGGLAVADAAEVAATALTQFKLSGKDIPHIADLLAAGAGKAQGSVEDIGNALKQSGLVASQFGLSIEDTTGTLAAFASAGLVGSDAGTSLKTMLLKLASPSKEAAGMMSDLGIAAYDAGGKFVGISGLANQLKDKLGGLTQAQRDSTLATIFGTDAIRGANVLYEQGSIGIGDWIDKVDDAGFAVVTASTKTDNLAGDLERLGGSFDSVLIKGGGGAAEALRGLVQGLEDVVDSVGKIPPGMLQFSVGAAGMLGAALLVGGGLLTVIPQIAAFRVAMAALSAPGGMPRAASAIGAVGKAAGIAVVSILALQAASALFTEKHTKSAEDYGQALLKVSNAADTLKGSGLDSIFGNFDIMFGTAVSNVDNLSDAVKRLTNQSDADGITKAWEPLTDFLGLPKGEISELEARLKGLGDEMGNLAKNGAGATAAKSFQNLTKEFQLNGQGAREALDHVPGYEAALKGLANTAGVALKPQELLDFALGKVPASMQAAATETDKATAATQLFSVSTGAVVPVSPEIQKALEDLGISAQGAVTDLDKYAAALVRAGLSNLSSADATRNYYAAIDAVDAAIKANGTTMDIHTEKGRANQAALLGIASAGLAEVQTMASATDAYGNHINTSDTLHGKMRTTYDDLLLNAQKFYGVGAEAEACARKAMGIPDNVDIDAFLHDFASKKLDDVGLKADLLNGKEVNITIRTSELFTKYISEIKNPTEADRNGDTFRPDRKATGGRVYGPGTTISDSIPTMLSRDEFVLKASRAKAIGYDKLDRLNGGDTQALQPMGYSYAPAAAPSGSWPALAASGGGGTVNNWNITEQSDPLATAHVVSRRQAALIT